MPHKKKSALGRKTPGAKHMAAARAAKTSQQTQARLQADKMRHSQQRATETPRQTEAQTTNEIDPCEAGLLSELFWTKTVSHTFFYNGCSVMEKVGGEEDGTTTEDTLSISTETKDNADNGAVQALAEPGSEPVNSKDEPPMDWFEPLEEDCEDEDDGQSCELDGMRDAEMESLAGESEWSCSIAGSERNYKRGRGGTAFGVKGRRRQFTSEEGWEDCPVLGVGWKRKEVLRRSGLSIGQKDVYYLSPLGDRVRSRIELLKYFGSTMDLTNFEYKTGQFTHDKPPKKVRKKRRKERYSPGDCGFSSESSFHNETADSLDRTYSPGPLFSLCISTQQNSNQSYVQKLATASITSPGKVHTIQPKKYFSSDAGWTSQTSSLTAKLQDGMAVLPPNAVLGICIRCRNSFTGVKGQKMCGKCGEACNTSKDTRKITFRKWLPCGFCRACQLSEDCGVCASCVNGKLNVQNRRPIRCRMRKCLRPLPKLCVFYIIVRPAFQGWTDDVNSAVKDLLGFGIQMRPVEMDAFRLVYPFDAYRTNARYHLVELWSKSKAFGGVSFSVGTTQEARLSERSINTNVEPLEPSHKESQYSDSDKSSPGDEDEGLLRRVRRTCGRCKGCKSKADCGNCDYCIDKPKFGGSNRKRQKCRQRRCQREVKGWVARSRPRPRYTYNYKIPNNSKEKWEFEISDNEGQSERKIKGSVYARHLDRDKHVKVNTNGQKAETETNQVFAEDQHLREVSGKRTREDDGIEQPAAVPQMPTDYEDDDMEPTITQIFSLGDNDPCDIDLDLELLELLSSLRDTMLPMLWCAVLAEGPCLQLLQCSKRSAMADTTVQIEPSFRYHISVQGQPLLPTHRLYHDHPAHLTSVEEVATLLEDLERYTVCRGFRRESPNDPEPIIQVRAATCEFLVVPEVQRCARCKSAQQKQGQKTGCKSSCSSDQCPGIK